MTKETGIFVADATNEIVETLDSELLTVALVEVNRLATTLAEISAYSYNESVDKNEVVYRLASTTLLLGSLRKYFHISSKEMKEAESDFMSDLRDDYNYEEMEENADDVKEADDDTYDE